jgi:hypothetical protein
LLNPEAVQPSDPKWRDLNDEHLGIARQYMKALKTVRAAVEALLQDDARALGTAASLAEIVLALKRILELKPGALVATQVILELDDLMVKLAERLEADPMFERALRELLETKTK